MSGWTNSELVLCALIKQSDAEATNCRDLSSLKEGALPSLSTFSYEWPKIPSFVRTLNVTQWVAALVQPFKESSCCRKRQYTDDCVQHPYRSLETKGIDSGSFDDLEY